MVQKYVFGSPFETEAVTAGPAAVEYTGQAVCGDIPVDISLENGFACSCQLADTDIVYEIGRAHV